MTWRHVEIEQTILKEYEEMLYRKTTWRHDSQSGVNCENDTSGGPIVRGQTIGDGILTLILKKNLRYHPTKKALFVKKSSEVDQL